MPGFNDVNNEMDDLDRQIDALAQEVEDKRLAYEQKKHELSLRYSTLVIEGKAKNPDWTQTDVVAWATTESSAEKLAMITAHSEYRRLKARLEAKQSMQETAREKSYNRRQELKRLA